MAFAVEDDNSNLIYLADVGVLFTLANTEVVTLAKVLNSPFGLWQCFLILGQSLPTAGKA